MKKYWLFAILTISLILLMSNRVDKIQKTPVNLLIITGSNNHDWQKTTLYLKQVYEESGLFKVDITEKPDSLKTKDLIKYEAIVSNWNAFPETSRKWGTIAEKAILDFVRDGKGFVFFHAASAANYDWPEYQEMAGATWGKSTHHGNIAPFEVKFNNAAHPVTKGISDFWITDELWVDLDQKPDIQILCTAFAPKENNGSDKNEPVVICNEFGKGRCFYNVLGHDVAAMKNLGWRTLMIRGTEWAARGTVSYPVPGDLTAKTIIQEKLSWRQGKNSITLLNRDRIVWQYNYDKKEGKPYFHPLALNDGTVLTWLRPSDHIWHRALWFSWKIINGLNYWEEDEKTGESEGISEIVKVEVDKHPDYSAGITINLSYHPPESKTILTEKRVVHLSRPDIKGNYFLDWTSEFTAGGQQVILDRTPIPGEKEGKSYGGYAGFSIRLSPDLWNVQLLNSEKDTTALHGKKARWLDIRAKSITGKDLQIIMMDDLRNQNSPAPWWISNDTKTPFYYFSPAPLFYDPMVLEAGQKLKLHYRLIVQSLTLKEEQIEEQYKLFIEGK
jgi:type 1 glutamine amidotransferase